MEQTIRKNYNNIDLFKFIMALVVVAIHTGPFAAAGPLINRIWTPLSQLAVPFFFLSSTFLIGDRNPTPEALLPALRKQTRKIAKLYLIWTAAYLPLTVYHFITAGYSVPAALRSFLQGTLFIGENFNSWMLWYLLSALYAQLFTIAMLKKDMKPWQIVIGGGVIFLLGSMISELMGYGGPLPSFLSGVKQVVSQTIVSGRILTGFLYIPLGILLSCKRPGPIVSLVLAIVGFAGNFFLDGIAGDVLLAISSVGVFCLILQISLKDAPIFSILRSLSTSVYFIHMYIWTLYYLLVYGYTKQGLDAFLVSAGISLIIAYAYIVIRRLHLTRKSS